MIKEFEISDILNAVDDISKIERKNVSTDKDDVLILNNQAITNKSEILVLDNMIE